MVVTAGAPMAVKAGAPAPPPSLVAYEGQPTKVELAVKAGAPAPSLVAYEEQPTQVEPEETEGPGHAIHK